jgi:hypothetical protein
MTAVPDGVVVLQENLAETTMPVGHIKEWIQS